MTQENCETKSSKQNDKKLSEDKKQEKEVSLLKVVIRRLPPSLTPETFLEQVSPLPDYDFFYFVKADMSLGSNAFTRAYINFTNQEDVFTFRDKFDNYIFVDGKGNEYSAIVEFSPFQKVPKRKVKKIDTKKGTIKEDSDYLKFLEFLENPEVEPVKTIDTYLEEIEAKEKDLKANHGCPKVTTPLIEFIKKRKEEKKAAIQRIREERKRKEQERRRQKEDERRKRREKERCQREKEKQKFKDGKDRGKDREKDKDKEQKDVPHKDEQQPVKLLKNPDREKDREKESVGKSEKESQEKPKEKLRFAKENRPGGKGVDRSSTPDKSRMSGGRGSDRPPERFRGGRDERPGSSPKDRKQSDRSKFGREWDRDRDREKDKFRNRDRDRDFLKEKDRTREREKDRDKERDTDRERGKEKDKESDRDWEKPREIDRDKNSDKDKDINREEKFSSCSGRDERRKSDNPLDVRERVLPVSAKKDTGIKPKVENNETWDKGKQVKCNQSKDSISSSQSSEGGAKSKTTAESRTDSDEDKARRKRKERPERQIYVPRKALERMQQESKSQTDTKRDKVESSASRNKDGKGDG